MRRNKTENTPITKTLLNRKPIGADVSRRRKQKVFRFVVSPIEITFTHKVLYF